MIGRDGVLGISLSVIPGKSKSHVNHYISSSSYEHINFFHKDRAFQLQRNSSTSLAQLGRCSGSAWLYPTQPSSPKPPNPNVAGNSVQLMCIPH